MIALLTGVAALVFAVILLIAAGAVVVAIISAIMLIGQLIKHF